MIQFKDECLKEGVVVHLSTQEQSDEFSKWLDSRGKKWCTGGRYTKESEWYKYTYSFCIYPYKGEIGSISVYKNTKYKILSYEEALLEEEYKTPDLTDLIDFTKCKDYYVGFDHNTINSKSEVRKGLFMRYGILHCYVDNNPYFGIESYVYFKEVPNKDSKIEELTKLQKELQADFEKKNLEILQKIKELGEDK